MDTKNIQKEWMIFGVILAVLVSGVSAQNKKFSDSKNTDLQIVDKNKFENRQKNNNNDKQKYVFIRGIQQGPRQCISTCASMILDEMGIQMTADKIEMLACGKIGSAPALSSIVKALEKQQIPLTMARYETKNGEISIISKYITDLLKKNTPSGVLKNRHMQVCVGFNETEKKFYFIDPTKAKEILVKSFDKFSQELATSPEIQGTGKIFLLHKKTDLEDFVLLPRQGRETSQSFVLNVQRGDENL